MSCTCGKLGENGKHVKQDLQTKTCCMRPLSDEAERLILEGDPCARLGGMVEQVKPGDQSERLAGSRMRTAPGHKRMANQNASPGSSHNGVEICRDDRSRWDCRGAVGEL